jgi:uncharacterized membrane protein
MEIPGHFSAEIDMLLFAVFAAWIFAAELIYVWLYGPNPPAGAIPE